MDTMHFCEPYGYLVENGRPMSDERIARNCGVSTHEYIALLAELDAAGIPKRTADHIIYSKRMVEDEKKRCEWRNRQEEHRLCHANVTPMSRGSPSSSASASANQNINPASQKTLRVYPRQLNDQKAKAEAQVGTGPGGVMYTKYDRLIDDIRSGKAKHLPENVMRAKNIVKNETGFKLSERDMVSKWLASEVKSA